MSAGFPELPNPAVAAHNARTGTLMRTSHRITGLLAVAAALALPPPPGCGAEAAQLRVACFQADITPPLGSALCDGLVMPAKEIVSPLTARGVILLGAGQPIVLCALDWVGVGNESYDVFREELARAAGTASDRVALHAVHQHDAPGSDFASERLLAEHGLAGRMSNAEFDRQALRRIAEAASAALAGAKPVTHVGLGAGRVARIASSRRILGPDGRVAAVRFGSCRDPQIIAAPEGTIDPFVRLVAFWNGDTPVAALTYYASHPHSYYGKGGVNWEFVGMARAAREQALPGVPHIHFCGAGGNVGAGKYNDGSETNRPALAGRLAEGMRLAWETQKKCPLRSDDVGWRACPVSLPVRNPNGEAALLAALGDASAPVRTRIAAARELVFIRRMQSGKTIPVTCLRLGDARIVHLPGELFVEYQLAAQAMRPDRFVALAAYGDYGPGYIGTAVAYEQGGYETEPRSSRTSPLVENVLTDAVRRALAGADGPNH